MGGMRLLSGGKKIVVIFYHRVLIDTWAMVRITTSA